MNGNGAFDSKLIADTKTGFTLFPPVQRVACG